jgi:hypothetical protein
MSLVRRLIPDWPATLAAYAVALLGFTALGLPFARKIAPRFVPPAAIAPALGWSLFTVLALPALSFTGFTAIACWGVAAAAAAAAAWMWHETRATTHASPLPRWSFAMAALLGLIPLMAIMPKHAQNGLLLAPPMFDHVKIAVVDAILRSGLPVPNPFYGPGGRGLFAYYYLWHFGAALFARLLGIGGWQAEAAMTGFTAAASIQLVIGLAAALGGGARAMAASALLCLPGSLRPVLALVAGNFGTNPFIPRKSDICAWLNQSAWVPQHLASACCVVLSALLMLRLAEDGGLVTMVALGLVVAAGFETSSWVGGIAFAVSAAGLGAWLTWRLPGEKRRGFLFRAVPAAAIAARFIRPFAEQQEHMLALRHTGTAIALAPYPTFGSLVPQALRAPLDLPGFWLVMLPFAFPALVPLAAFALYRPAILHLAQEQRRLAHSLAILALCCLSTSWLLRSTIENNDLGWRAVLPALLVMPAFAGCMAENLAARRPLLLASLVVLALLGVPESVTMLREYAGGVRPGDPIAFAETQPMWQALRGLSGPEDRVASNPLLAQAATFWPVNDAWALLSDRPSCYAGWQSVAAYGPISRPQLQATDDRFARVFAGHPAAGDIQALARNDDCRFVAITKNDGAWPTEPSMFAPDYQIAASGSAWRIYQRVAAK